MKTSVSALAAAAFIAAPMHAEQPAVAEQLGYAPDAILLIVHADDLGLAHSKNAASFDALLNGSVSSASIMMPTPWITEVAAEAKKHPELDLGLHLTVTSEWDHYKWGPVAPVDEVRSLVDARGYFYASVGEFAANAKPAEVERELRAQIERAYAFGLDPTHLDMHMMALGATPDLQQIYLKLAAEYRLPPLTMRGMAQAFFGYDDSKLPIQPAISVDGIHSVDTSDFPDRMDDRYRKILQTIGPGLHEIIIHAAHDDAEMQAIAVNHPLWGATWRAADYRFFTSEECKKIIAERGIQLVTWREIRDEIVRAPTEVGLQSDPARPSPDGSD